MIRLVALLIGSQIGWEAAVEAKLRDDTRVVLVGSLHYDRAEVEFACRLSRRLESRGFHYLGLELKAAPDKRNPEEYERLTAYARGETERPVSDTIDSVAPGWLDLIASAKDRGIKIVCYMPPRDVVWFNDVNEQSARVIRAVLKADAAAKMVIFCGANHCLRQEVNGDIGDWIRNRLYWDGTRWQYVPLRPLGFYLADAGLLSVALVRVEPEYYDLLLESKP